MARRIQPIFDRIFAAFEANDPRLGGQSSFVKSLQESYNRKKSLTRRQKEALLRVEAALDGPMPTVDADMETRLTTLVSRAKAAKDTWAVDFGESLLYQVRRGKGLSKRQEEVLCKVEARHTDADMEALENWEQNFSSEMREKMEIVARYYKNAGYFRELVEDVLSNPDFVPSKRQWDKMVENKYAKKVIESTFSEPKYNVGQMVALRSSAKVMDSNMSSATPYRFGLRSSVSTGFVVAVGSKPVINAARNTKVYTVLFMGKTDPVYVEERFLKKAKR